MPDKDQNERFERAQKKPRHWRIVVGLLLLAGPSVGISCPIELSLMDMLEA
jgi:hypothetical protein